jgi:hypothetical protein
MFYVKSSKNWYVSIWVPFFFQSIDDACQLPTILQSQTDRGIRKAPKITTQNSKSIGNKET